MDPPEELITGLINEKARRRSGGSSSTGRDDTANLLSGSIQDNLTKMVWDAGRTQVRQVFSLYANIDLFRPYFDVEPKKVRNQLILSLLPQKPSHMQKLTHDLYAPVMISLTLVALLLYAMKTSNFSVQDGTLIGAALFTCFGYWAFSSIAIYTMSYLFVTAVTFLQCLSLMGYAMFGNCVILSLTSFVDAFSHSHTIFYLLFIVFGIPPALRVAIFFMSRTPDRSHKFIIGPAIVFLHCAFMLYLHYGFHEVMEEIGEIFETRSEKNIIAPITHSVENLVKDKTSEISTMMI